VNISLLAKWKWKLLSREHELWKDVVVARYGIHVMGKRKLGELDITRTGSLWWRDICLIEKDSDWFDNAIRKKIGNGNATSFWNEHWIGNHPLRQGRMHTCCIGGSSPHNKRKIFYDNTMIHFYCKKFYIVDLFEPP
jgi:hypothetical protein